MIRTAPDPSMRTGLGGQTASDGPLMSFDTGATAFRQIRSKTRVANAEADEDTGAKDRTRHAGTENQPTLGCCDHRDSTMLTHQQFDRTRRLALRLAGIEILERHREVLARRNRRLGLVDSASLDALLAAAEKGEAVATQQFLCLLTTKFTGFFRHPRHFHLAAEHARRAAMHHGRARLWSAAAATGEEPYSLAIALIETFRRDDPPVTILATDLAADALAVAQRGEYGQLTLRAVEPSRRDRFFTETDPGRRWAVAPPARRLVEFRMLNLISPAWAVDGPFDVIFCRNVLMYLGAGHRCAVLERLASLLAPDGLLMLDPTEHLGQAGSLFTPVADGVSSRRPASSLGANRARCTSAAFTGG